MNLGHGHVVPRDDGVKARCGGPAFCVQCAGELVDQTQRMELLNQLYQLAFQDMAQRDHRSLAAGFAHRAGIMAVYLRGLKDAREELKKNNAKS